MKNILLKIIDSGYFIVKKIIPLKTYRYAVCGGGNLILDTLLYSICFHFIFQKTNLDLNIIVISPHIASLFFVFPITFFIGFLLNRYIVFSASQLTFKTQFLRYLSVALMALLISYVTLKLFVDMFHFYPTPSRVLSILITVLFSYIMQNKFSFKTSSSQKSQLT